MRSIKWLIAAGLIVATTAACTEQYGYPSTSYNTGYNNTGYNTGTSGYYNNGRYYGNNTGYSTTTQPARGPNGDYDRDGVPNRYDRDANGDGVPDRYQR